MIVRMSALLATLFVAASGLAAIGNTVGTNSPVSHVRAWPADASLSVTAAPDDELVSVTYVTIGDQTWCVETWKKPNGSTYDVWIPCG